MIDHNQANALIDAEDNRHRRKGKATVFIGVVHPFKRYIWLHRDQTNVITVTLFGNEIAWITPEGTTISTCGHYKPTTRLALETVVGAGVSMETPGSRGGPGEGPGKGYFGGREIPEGGLFVPAKVAS